MYNIVKYCNSNGKCPIDDYILELLKNNKRLELEQINYYIKMLEEYGHRLKENQSYVKHLEDKLYELRPGNNRIIYFYYNNNQEYVLLHGFRKKTRKTPPNEIEKAKKEMKEYERMNKNERK